MLKMNECKQNGWMFKLNDVNTIKKALKENKRVNI